MKVFLFVLYVLVFVGISGSAFALPDDYSSLREEIIRNEEILKESNERMADIVRQAEMCSLGLYVPPSNKTALDRANTKKTYRSCLDFFIEFARYQKYGLERPLSAGLQLKEIQKKALANKEDYPGFAAWTTMALTRYVETSEKHNNRLRDIVDSVQEWMTPASEMFPELKAEFERRWAGI